MENVGVDLSHIEENGKQHHPADTVMEPSEYNEEGLSKECLAVECGCCNEELGHETWTILRRLAEGRS